MKNSVVTVNIILAILSTVLLAMLIPMFIRGAVLKSENNRLRQGEVKVVTKEVEVEVEKPVEVEKIVYKDSPETLERLKTYEDMTTLLAEGYVTMFEVAESSAIYFGQPIHQDWYDLYVVALEVF